MIEIVPTTATTGLLCKGGCMSCHVIYYLLCTVNHAICCGIYDTLVSCGFIFNSSSSSLSLPNDTKLPHRLGLMYARSEVERPLFKPLVNTSSKLLDDSSFDIAMLIRCSVLIKCPYI